MVWHRVALGRVERCGPGGEVWVEWGGAGRCGEVWGGVGREITVATASCGEGRRVCGGEPEQDFSYMFIHIHTFTHVIRKFAGEFDM